MKIYVSCDMEGTAGVCSWMQVDPANAHEYPVYRRYMAQEVRAAIDGARDAGASDVVINDSHWDMRNVLWDELPGDVRVISGSRKPWSMTQGVDASFAGAFFTGYHAKIGDANGTLAHTYSPGAIYEVRMNGIACSEALLNAAMAGYYGVPVLLITGDRTIVEETQRHIPGCTGAIVKESIGHYSVDSMSPAAAQRAIADAAREAMTRRSAVRPFRFESPVEMQFECAKVECADFIELMPGFERLNGRTLRFVHDDYRMVFRAFIAAMRLGGAALAVA